MKNTLSTRVLVSLGILALMLFVCVVLVLRFFSHYAWMNMTPLGVQRIAVDVECFRSDEGRYPFTLTDLLTNEMMNSEKDNLKALLHGGRYQYDYQLVSNGFAITVVSPPGLFNRGEVMVRQFAPGEALSTNKN
jgi:hypothetical protein